jgi:DNA-binding NarL/FixJ family response regulator
VKLLIVDDHPVVRAGLAALLQQIETDATVLQASDALSAFQISAANPDIDLVLLDLMMPGTEGVSAIAEFGKSFPQLPVAVLSSSEAPADVRRALNAGALGYIPKSAAPQTLLAAVRMVLLGEVYVPPLMIVADDSADAARDMADLPGPVMKLTERQVAVLKLVCLGRSNKEIARDMAVSEKTVKAHVTSIFRALNVVNRTQAARVAAAAGLA